ncbi:hypothetical protein ACN28I_14840 [Archangium gephyra]|uniref:hypothetical protein n=1 Tax=Archangium gephyra TaxID=48 RepID=UPI003B8038B8
MKKVLIGVGIGCGSLVLVGIIAVVAGGFWMKGKAEEYSGDIQAAGKTAEETRQRADALNQKYPFSAPAKGVPVTIEEKRLQEYLAVRTTLQPVFKAYEQKAKELQSSAGENPGLGDAFKAMSQLTSFISELQSTWIDQLEGKKMSPREYHAITAALYTSNWGAVAGDMRRQQRPMFEQAKKTLEQQLAATQDAEMKAALEEQLASINEQLAQLPAEDAVPGEAEKVHKANQVLYTKYKAQIEEQAQHGLDFILLGQENDSSLGEALENIHTGTEPDGANEEME